MEATVIIRLLLRKVKEGKMAIVKPENMQFGGKKFNVILYGPPGVGKTTCALSAPDPVLIDCDKGIGRVRADHRRLTIMSDSYKEILSDLDSPEIRACQTIVIDTGGSLITLLQEWAMAENPKNNKKRTGAISIQGFGAVKSEYLRFAERLRVGLNKNVITVFHSVEEKEKNGDGVKQRLMCEGAAKNLVWTPCDFGGFMTMVGNERRVYFAPEEEFFAKRCFGIKPWYTVPDVSPGTPNDFLACLFAEASANIQADADAYAEAKTAYAAAMEKGCEIVDGVTDAETALAATESIKGIPHALTSQEEIRVLFSRKLSALDLMWNKAAQMYVPKDGASKSGNGSGKKGDA